MKIFIDQVQLHQLHTIAVQNSTLRAWSEVALQWIDEAAAEIAKLQHELQQRSIPDDRRDWDEADRIERLSLKGDSQDV